MNKRSEITKKRIMSSASELFLQKGYTATTVREICSASGISLSRVNYHFTSKAALAGEICRSMFQNLYSELKTVLKNSRTYSFVTEAVALRFLVNIILDEEHPASRFYCDVAAEGILADVFTVDDQTQFSSLIGEISPLNTVKLENRMNIYTRIFASSLSAISLNWKATLSNCDGDVVQARKLMQDIFAGLFMQMLDMPHDAQKAMLDISDAYYRLVTIQLSGLTDITVLMPFEMPLREKVAVVASAVGKDAIKLKSSDDHRSIELDVVNTSGTGE